MQNRIAVFALIVLRMGIGRALIWRRIVPERSADTRNRVVPYVNLPAAVRLPWLLQIDHKQLRQAAARLGTMH